jgi:hypothetical protein
MKSKVTEGEMTLKYRGAVLQPVEWQCAETLPTMLRWAQCAPYFNLLC